MTMAEHKSDIKLKKDTHTLPSQVRYGVPLVRIWEEIDHILKAPQCILHATWQQQKL